MADQKISARTAVVGSLVGTELIPAIWGVAEVKITAQQIADLVPPAFPGPMVTVKVSLTSAQILALNTTPKTLVAAPGAGKLIMPIRILFYLHFGTVAYTTNTTLLLGPGTVFATTMAGALSFNVDEIYMYTVTSNGGATPPSGSINVPMQLQASGGNPAAGDSTIDVYFTYQVITL